MPQEIAAIQRKNMVDCQLRPNQVTDQRILDAMEQIPRERFLPRHLQGVACLDEDLPLGEGRYLMEPVVFARLVQELRIVPSDLVLIVGAGCGYGAAVVASLAATVIGVESSESLLLQASAQLGALAIGNVVMIRSGLGKPFPNQGPYNVILFEGAIETLPGDISADLAPGGRVGAVVRQDGGSQAWVWTQSLQHCTGVPLFEAATPLLPGAAREMDFVF